MRSAAELLETFPSVPKNCDDWLDAFRQYAAELRPGRDPETRRIVKYLKREAEVGVSSGRRAQTLRECLQHMSNQ